RERVPQRPGRDRGRRHSHRGQPHAAHAVRADRNSHRRRHHGDVRSHRFGAAGVIAEPEENIKRSRTMARMTPSEFARQGWAGLLSFPVTCFKDDLSFDEAKYRDHVAWLGEHKVAGLFAAGGTGEFFSLSLGEVEKVVHAAVAETDGRVPVIAGTGYGTAIAK